MLQRWAWIGTIVLLLAGSLPVAAKENAIAAAHPAAWYASAEARALADTVLLYQRDAGGWPKNHDMTRPPDPQAFEHTDVGSPTIDNGATYTPIRFLAAVDAAQDDPRYRVSIQRGLDYLLAAQYGNGGWPQFYPLRPGYYTHITFNDDAMVGVLALLRDVAAGRAPFAWVDAKTRARSGAAVEKGIACILRCQIVVNGVKTAWCAQHDEITFEPVPARAYEHVSLSGNETVGIVRFLMSVDSPSPEIVAAVQAAVNWLEQVKLSGIRVERVRAPGLPRGFDRVVTADPHAPPLWARFYEIGTNRPIFGGRDTTIHYALAEIEPERRTGYNWYGDKPQDLLTRDYPRWAARYLPAHEP
jgi:PelA/Pel-15E family pectate lyase